jgi:hypothetical protein
MLGQSVSQRRAEKQHGTRDSVRASSPAPTNAWKYPPYWQASIATTQHSTQNKTKKKPPLTLNQLLFWNHAVTKDLFCLFPSETFIVLYSFPANSPSNIFDKTLSTWGEHPHINLGTGSTSKDTVRGVENIPTWIQVTLLRGSGRMSCQKLQHYYGGGVSPSMNILHESKILFLL